MAYKHARWNISSRCGIHVLHPNVAAILDDGSCEIRVAHWKQRTGKQGGGNNIVSIEKESSELQNKVDLLSK